MYLFCCGEKRVAEVVARWKGWGNKGHKNTDWPIYPTHLHKPDYVSTTLFSSQSLLPHSLPLQPHSASPSPLRSPTQPPPPPPLPSFLKAVAQLTSQSWKWGWPWSHAHGAMLSLYTSASSSTEQVWVAAKLPTCGFSLMTKLCSQSLRIQYGQSRV